MLYQTSATIPSQMRDFPEWRHGRKSYAVWVLRCDENQALQEKFNNAREHLNDYLLGSYHRQPHITLFVCGFLVEKHQYNDDFTQRELDSQIQTLEKADIEPFEIEINGLNSFASAPFLEVHDPDKGIPRLRKILSGSAREFRPAAYRPHLTVGLYADAFPSEKILERIAAFANNPIRCVVEKVTLATYQAKEITGELSYKYNYWFKA
jgi:2'-5' RNA ligase